MQCLSIYNGPIRGAIIIPIHPRFFPPPLPLAYTFKYRTRVVLQPPTGFVFR